MHISAICEQIFQEDTMQHLKRVSAVNIKEVLCCACALIKAHRLSLL